MKAIRFFWLSLVTTFKRHKLAFCLYLFVQTVISIGFIYFFTTIISLQANYFNAIKDFHVARITLSADSPGEQSAFTEQLIKNPVFPFDELFFNFIDPDKSDERKQFFAAWPPQESLDLYEGRMITRADTEQQARVVISSNAQVSPNAEDNETFAVGDRMTVHGESFEVIGISNRSNHYVPYTTGLQCLRVSEIQFLMPTDITGAQKTAFEEYVFSLPGRPSVWFPPPPTEKAIQSLSFPLLFSILIGICSILNFLFIFKYLLNSSRKEHAIYRICGCSGSRLTGHIFAQLTGLFTASFAAGAGLYAVFHGIYRDSNIFEGIALDWVQILMIYLICVTLIMLVMLRYVLRYRREFLKTARM